MQATEARRYAGADSRRKRRRTRSGGAAPAAGLPAEARERWQSPRAQTLVRNVAAALKRRLPNSVSIDELVSDGNLGLLAAARGFDPERGVKFETFATQRIRGAMLDGLRERDFVPRLDRERGTAREMQRMDDVALIRVRGAAWDECLDRVEQADLLESVCGGMEWRERQIVRMRYMEDLTQREIGLKLGLSESRISQMLTAILRTLRATLKLNGDAMIEQENNYVTLHRWDGQWWYGQDPLPPVGAVAAMTHLIRVPHGAEVVCERGVHALRVPGACAGASGTLYSAAALAAVAESRRWPGLARIITTIV